jgi:hypothetical protein
MWRRSEEGVAVSWMPEERGRHAESRALVEPSDCRWEVTALTVDEDCTGFVNALEMADAKRRMPESAP